MRIVRRHSLSVYLIVAIFIFTVSSPTTNYSLAYTATAEPSAAQLDWLEPHGVSIIDLVGEVPEEVLRDAIVVYSNNGMLQYLSGQRTGNTVTINTRVTPRYAGSGASEHSLVNCLGQPALTDSWPIVSPAGVMRVYENGVEITGEAWLQRFAPGGRMQPLHNPNTFRYPEGDTTVVQLTEDGAIPIPENRGCAIVFPGFRSNLTATFTVETPKYIAIRTLGSETFTFQSYIGPGATGEIGGLASQLSRNFPNRHDKFAMNIPEGAQFALVTFPPTPVHPYVNEPIDLNLQLPGSGTYRIGRKNSLNLSVDHAVTAAIPLYWQPRDADQSGGETYLPTFTEPGELASLEYFVPVGVEYNRCMRAGTCSNAIIRQIYDAQMEMTIHYLAVDRINVGLDRIPLKQVGPRWSPGQTTAQIAGQTVIGAVPGTVPPANGPLYLPLVLSDIRPDVPPADRAGCPCGWFTPEGRMVDFIPGP